MTRASEIVSAPDGERLHLRRWQPAEGDATVAVVLVHGLGEHSGCYDEVASYLALRGAAVYAQDHRGFGRSGGRRGHVARYERYVDDARRIVVRARMENDSLPLVLLGHSMGGTVALLLTLRHPELFDLAIYSAPALLVKAAVPRRKRALALALNRLYPTFTDVAVSNPALLTRDPAVQESVRLDELRHTRRTVRLYTEMFVRGPREVLARAGELRLPFLLLHGDDDPLVPVDASRALYAAASSPDRTLRVYPGLRHEVLREIERAAVFADVADWLIAHGIHLRGPATTAAAGSPQSGYSGKP